MTQTKLNFKKISAGNYQATCIIDGKKLEVNAESMEDKTFTYNVYFNNEWMGGDVRCRLRDLKSLSAEFYIAV
tara:strand:- start:310 stop:528 length:219 start_codon:yes stop_codon:yes gene_type:complete